MADKRSEKQTDGEESKTPVLEWAFAVIGLILVVGVIGFLFYQIAVNKGTPPNLVVKTSEIVQGEKGFLVKFIIENTGDETAADVTVEGELKQGEKSVETGDVTVDYVPAHSQKKGGLFFTKNPGEFELILRAKGYNEP